MEPIRGNLRRLQLNHRLLIQFKLQDLQIYLPLLLVEINIPLPPILLLPNL